MLAAFKPYLQQRVEQEPDTGNQLLFAEIRARGYRGSLRTLREYLAQIRRPGPRGAAGTRGALRPADHRLDHAPGQQAG